MIGNMFTKASRTRELGAFAKKKLQLQQALKILLQAVAICFQTLKMFLSSCRKAIANPFLKSKFDIKQQH